MTASSASHPAVPYDLRKTRRFFCVNSFCIDWLRLCSQSLPPHRAPQREIDRIGPTTQPFDFTSTRFRVSSKRRVFTLPYPQQDSFPSWQLKVFQMLCLSRSPTNCESPFLSLPNPALFSCRISLCLSLRLLRNLVADRDNTKQWISAYRLCSRALLFVPGPPITPEFREFLAYVVDKRNLNFGVTCQKCGLMCGNALVFSMHEPVCPGPPSKEVAERHDVTKTKMEADVYEVAEILDHRATDSGEVEYYIRWDHYGPESNSWELASEVYAPELVRQYHNKGKAAKRAKGKK